MAKDAKGHGSDARGSAGGGKRDWAGRTDADLEHDYGGPVRHFDDASAKAELGGGHPKSGDVPVHSSLSENIAAFKAKYGGPRDHAREQRSFNRGKREINRLRKQGK